MGCDGVFVDHILREDVLEDRSRQLKIDLAHINTRMTRLDDLKIGKENSKGNCFKQSMY